jgi:Cu2+-containing amine oxidase
LKSKNKDLLKTHQLEGDKMKTGRGNNYIRQISNPEDQKMKWIQKTLFINLLKNVIEKIGSIHLNNLLKPEIIKTYLLIQRKFKIKHKGLLVLIELFGDPEQQIAEYKANNKNKSLERDDDVDLVSIKSHKVQNNLKGSVRQRKNSIGKYDSNMINLSVQHQTTKVINLAHM